MRSITRLSDPRTRRSAARRCVLAALLCSGCGPSAPALYPVGRVVRFATGEPVRRATVEFVPVGPGARPAPRSRTDSDGRFRLGTYESEDGAAAGDYRVVVVQPLPPATPGVARDLGAEHDTHVGQSVVVSTKHAAFETTGIQRRVSAGGVNDFEIVVEPSQVRERSPSG